MSDEGRLAAFSTLDLIKEELRLTPAGGIVSLIMSQDEASHVKMLCGNLLIESFALASIFLLTRALIELKRPEAETDPLIIEAFERALKLLAETGLVVTADVVVADSRADRGRLN